MKQIIVNVGDLTVEEKQLVNEALASIKNIIAPKITNMRDIEWFYAGGQIAWSYGSESWEGLPATHTPQQVLEMAGTTLAAEQIILADTLIITDSSGNIIYDSTLGALNRLIKKQGHIHAELMQQYADDAKAHAEPWLLWQTKAKDGFWWNCSHHPLWGSSTEYRRKPKTHIVHGVEIPDLRVSPECGDYYYLASTSSHTHYSVHTFDGVSMDKIWVDRGLVYQHTEEGKQAAILHAKAMLDIA